MYGCGELDSSGPGLLLNRAQGRVTENNSMGLYDGDWELSRPQVLNQFSNQQEKMGSDGWSLQLHVVGEGRKGLREGM